MSDPQGGKGNSLGLTVGATNLAGAGDGQRAVIRPSALTLDQGITLAGFVDRVGDPVPIVAEDGSRHRPEMLLVEALDGVARTSAKTPVSEVAIAVPAHWRPAVVDALRGALRSKPGLTRSPLVSDAAAAVTALRAAPGLPTSGVIVLCDFGGSGASITLVDAAANDAQIGETMRVPDFSGDLIDQAILTKVVEGVFEASGADPAGTSMVGSLTVLRDECRRAKERLSDEAATAIAVDVPGMETNVRMTRTELDALIAAPLGEFLGALADTLDRNRIPLASIAAVATVGGGARIPLITQRLSEHLRTAVVTTRQPQLTAAAGAALIAHRSQIVESATAMAPAAAPATAMAPATPAVAPSPAVGGALAWSQVDDDAYDVLHTAPYLEDAYVSNPADSRPEVHFEPDQWNDDQPQSRRRSPALLFGLAGAAVAFAAVVVGLTVMNHDTATVPAGTSSSIAPMPAPVAEQKAPAADAPAPAQAPVVTTVAARPQPRSAPQPQQAPVSAPAPAHPAPAPEAPAPEPPAPAPQAPAPEPQPDPAPPAPAPQNPAPQNPAPQNPAPQNPAPTDPGTGTPPADPGTGGTGTGSGGTGTGTGGTGTGTGSGTGAEAPAGAGGEEKVPAKPGLFAPILEPILTPQS